MKYVKRAGVQNGCRPSFCASDNALGVQAGYVGLAAAQAAIREQRQ